MSGVQHRCIACGSIVLTENLECQHCDRKTCLVTEPVPIGECFACPECGFASDIDDFDCIGADDGYVFCPECNAEFDPSIRTETSGAGPRYKCKRCGGAATLQAVATGALLCGECALKPQDKSEKKRALFPA